MEDLEYSKLRTDLSNCDRELIHIPGTIQAFGILICLSDPGLQICNFSANIISTLGYTLEEFLSQSFFSLVRAEDHTFLNELVKAKGSKVKNPYAIALKKSDGKYLPFLAFLHRSENNLILELEPLEDNPPILMDLYRETISSISALQGVESLTELCQRATEAVQSLTGFDRVMIYQFDPNWNGHVIAEALSSVGKVDSYKGHHFPASDIPSQSRAVLLQNWLRMIPDVDCKPVPILPSAGPLSQRPLNLSRAFLRSVSPIHIRYLKNMGVVSSLTVSLKHERKLWGLISCHHRKAYLVSHSARVVCRLIGRHISSLLGITGEVEDLHYLRKLRSIHDSLVKFMLAEEDLIQGLIKYSPNLLDLAASKGASAAIYLGKGWTLVGRTPEIPQIEALVDWLIHHHSKEDVFYTHSLSSLVPEAIAYKDVASGLLAINIPRTENSYILWFRPEIPKVVTWAGDPNKNVEILPDGTLKIEPRSSFEAWIENVQNQALDWRPVEIEAARTLRTSILGIDLQRLVKKEQEARTRAEELVLQREKDIHQLRSERILRESFVATLTHDLRTPLTAARLSAQLINMNPADKDRAQKQSEKIFLNIDRVDQMITDLLDANQIRAGQKLSLNLVYCDLKKLIEEVMQELIHVYGNRFILQILEPINGYWDCTKIRRAVENLCNNAVKYGFPDRPIIIGVQRASRHISVSVHNEGKVLTPQEQSRLFEPFHRTHSATLSGRKGWGLGLTLVRGVTEAHGGTIAVRSTLHEGTSFTITLPIDARKFQEEVSKKRGIS